MGIEKYFLIDNEVVLPLRIAKIIGYTGRVVSENNIYFLKNGYYHRLNDRPAILFKNGVKEWWVNGKRHRIGGLAVLNPGGAHYFWFEGHYCG